MSCDDSPNCGWIIVNIDGDDVAIPAASTQGSANFELLNAKLDDTLVKPERGAKKARQLYYFSPFDQAIEDQDLNVATLSDGSDEQPSHDKLKKKIDAVKAIKQSDAFKNKKAEFEDKGLTSFARRSPLAMLGAYASATTIPDTFVPGASTSMCGSRIPCYKYNATYNYSGGTCQFGCVATALAMIY